MSSATIHYGNDQVGMGKRVYLPIVVESVCPVCGDVRRVDLRDQYLMYPCVNGEVEISFVCGDDLCDGVERHQHEGVEWSARYVLRVRLEEKDPVDFDELLKSLCDD